MKHLLNTLYITLPESYLAREGECVLVRQNHETRLRVPIHNLAAVICFGQVGCSPPLMGFCAERGVGLTFCSESGRFLCRVQGPVSGNVLLRREQYRRAENSGHRLEIARLIVAAKLANSRSVILRAAREIANPDHVRNLQAAAAHLLALQFPVQKCPDLNGLRGLEGDGAREYFAVLDHMLVANKEAFYFRERSRRPPLDNLNALLSFVYTLLLSDLVAALEGVGLDPAVGFLHVERPGRPSLALDLMEEFRSVLADRLVLSLINRRQVEAGGFTRREGGGVVMDDETRKTVLVAWQKRKQEEVMHPFLGESAPLGLFPHLQALLLARFLRRDLDAYPALIWK